MAEVLLINRDDIMRLTGLNGNIDTDKILPHIKTSQDIHLQTFLGTKLLDECKRLVEVDQLDDPANADYKTLVETYITPFLVFYSMVDFLPFLAFEFANGGIYQHQSENSTTPDMSQLDNLGQKFKDKAEFYGRRMEAYLCQEGSKAFPELNQAEAKDMQGDTDELFNGWVI